MSHRVIINFQDVNEFIDKIKQESKIEKTWLDKKLRSYLMAEYKNVRELDEKEVLTFFKNIEIPTVIQKALDHEEKIYSIAFPNTFKNKVIDLGDYINHAIYNAGINPLGMPFAVALTNSEEWHKSFGKKKRKVSDKITGLRILETFEDDSFLAKLVTKSQFDYEGQMMNHCVSSYYGHKRSSIMSYRNADNKPLMTIEYIKSENGKDVSIIQARGFANREFIDQEYVANILKHLYSNYRTVSFSDAYTFGELYKGKPLLALPENFKFNGTQYFNDCIGLPKNATFNSDLRLERGRMKVLKNINVDGNIHIENSKIYAIDSSVNVSGKIYINTRNSLVVAVAKELKDKIVKIKN